MGPSWCLATGGPDAGDGRAASVVAVHLIDGLDAPAARAVVAALRDRVAGSVLLLVERTRAALSDADLRALAFRPLAREGECVLYGFDLHEYKDRPDWLNARFWAHPERWDRFRW